MPTQQLVLRPPWPHNYYSEYELKHAALFSPQYQSLLQVKDACRYAPLLLSTMKVFVEACHHHL